MVKSGIDKKGSGDKMACGSYAMFLTLLMFNRVFNLQTLAFVCGDQKLAYYYRNKAIKNGHIHCSRYTMRERTKHVYVVYTLTKKGFHYLLEHDKNIKYLFPSEDCAILKTLKKDDYKPERKIRIARTSEALAFAEASGASIPSNNFISGLMSIAASDDEAGDGLSIEEYLCDNLTDEVFVSLGLYGKTSIEGAGIVFYTGNCIKSMYGEKNNSISVRDVISGRYSGVAESFYKSVLIYTAPVFGMGWSKWYVNKEITVFEIWKKAKSITSELYRFSNGPSAALIVQNPKQFANLYFDVDHERRQSQEKFGGEFQQLYILPLNDDGIKHFRWLMATDDVSFDGQTVNDAIKSGNFVKNKGAYFSLFPLLNEKGQRTALGFQLDAKKMLQIEATAKALPKETFQILCLDWQETYYHAVMPDNVFTVSIPVE